MKKIAFDDPYTRKTFQPITVNDVSKCSLDIVALIDIDNPEVHLSYIENLKNGFAFDEKKFIMTELKKKYSSYKSQDKLKSKFDSEQHISFDELIDKLYDSQLKCYYCMRNLKLVSNKKLDKSCWSLERLDNNLGHYGTNTCISCVGCNLQRRTDNYEYFKMSKQLKVMKKKE